MSIIVRHLEEEPRSQIKRKGNRNPNPTTTIGRLNSLKKRIKRKERGREKELEAASSTNPIHRTTRKRAPRPGRSTAARSPQGNARPAKGPATAPPSASAAAARRPSPAQRQRLHRTESGESTSQRKWRWGGPRLAAYSRRRRGAPLQPPRA
jgi:hypothetical protein